jgi:hypothetical protein
LHAIGANDGLITTCAIVGEGGALSSVAVIVIGGANLAADGVWKHGIATTLAFVVAGMIPLVLYVLPAIENRLLWSSVLTFVALFILGASRALVTIDRWWRSGSRRSCSVQWLHWRRTVRAGSAHRLPRPCRSVQPSTNFVVVICARRRLDHDLVVDRADAWCVRRRTFGRVSLQPGANRSGQCRTIARHGHTNVARVHVCVPMQRLDDAMPDVTLDRTRGDGDAVHDVVHAPDVSDRALRVVLLEHPVNDAGECDVPEMNRRLHAGWNGAVQLERFDHIGRDVGVGAFQLQADLDVVGDTTHAADPFGRSFSRELARIRVE